jgi:drug/metabolite transporter (DMT)-like permease
VTLALALLEAEAIAGSGPRRPGTPIRRRDGLVGAGLSLGGSSLLYLLIQRGAATTVTSLMYLVPPTRR